MKKVYFGSCLLLMGLFPLFTWSQQELGLHFVPGVLQSNQTNPAFMQEKKITFALPSFHFNFSNSGFTINDLIVDVEGVDSTRLDVDAVIPLLNEKNDLHGRFQLDLLAFALRLNKLQLSISASTHFLSHLRYPKILAEVGWNGNASFLNDTVRFSPKFSSMAYHTIAVGGAYELNERLRIGGKIKYLIGVADISTGRDYAAFFTNEEYYQTTFITDVQINTSMVDIGDPEDIEFDYEFEPFSSNTGIVFDLGVDYQINERFRVSGSIINLGSAIRWDENVSNFLSQGNYTFEGIDIGNLLTGGTVDTDSIIDEISENFEFSETNFSYRTKIPTMLYLSSVFTPIPSLRLGGLLYQEWYDGAIFPAFTLSANKELGKVFSGGLTYSVRRGSSVNLGMNILLKGGPILFFMNTDNIIGLVSPASAKGTSLRLGLNLRL